MNRNLCQFEWRRGNKKYRMSSRATVGMDDHMKAALRLAAEKLSKIEGRKVSMSEVMRRLAAAGGIR